MYKEIIGSLFEEDLEIIQSTNIYCLPRDWHIIDVPQIAVGRIREFKKHEWRSLLQ